MLRTFALGLSALLVCACGLMAQQGSQSHTGQGNKFHGTISNVDSKKHTLTVATPEGKEQTIHVNKQTKVSNAQGEAVHGGLNAAQFRTGAPVEVSYTLKDGLMLGTAIRFVAAGKEKD